jgi:glutamine amidotransferase
MADAGIAEPLRFTATLADGARVLAFRYSSDERAPSLYFQCAGEGTVVASEPLDHDRGLWVAVPRNHMLVCGREERCEVMPFVLADGAVAQAA